MSAFILQRVFPNDPRRFNDVKRVVNALEELPEGKAWRVEIEEVKSERSLRQNKYLFGVAYKMLSETLGYERPDLHDKFCREHFGTKLVKVPHCRNFPEGLKEVPLRTTTHDEHGRRSVLGKIAFWELVEYIQRWGAEAGIHIPDPDPTLAVDYQECAA